MEILKENGAVLFKTDSAYYSFPEDTIVLVANYASDAINVRLLGSRKNVLTFDYQKVTNITAQSAADFITEFNGL